MMYERTTSRKIGRGGEKGWTHLKGIIHPQNENDLHMLKIEITVCGCHMEIYA